MLFRSNNYSDDYHPDLVNDEAFQVWMRLAGLPTFSKLVQRNDTAPMLAGTYTLDIVHRKSSSVPSVPACSLALFLT